MLYHSILGLLIRSVAAWSNRHQRRKLFTQAITLHLLTLCVLTCLGYSSTSNAAQTTANAAPLAPSQTKRILVLGDSISAAFGLSLEQGWVALMEGRLQQQGHSVEFINASISGETTSGGLRRLPQLLERHQPHLAIIELGGNDGLRGYPLRQLRENLLTMVNLCKRSGAAVILLPMEIPPNYGSRYTQGFRDSYSTTAKDTKTTLGPFLLQGIATDPTLMQSDGIHPTAAAQPMIVDNLLPALGTALKAL